MLECSFLFFLVFSLPMCTQTTKAHIQHCSSFLPAVGSRMKLLRGAEMMETVQKGGDNLRTGGYGIVYLDHHPGCHAISIHHSLQSHTLTAYWWDRYTLHTSHVLVCHTPVPACSVDGFQKFIHFVHRRMCIKACACIFKSVSVVMNVTVTSLHTACVRQRNALADAACLTHWAEMQLSELGYAGWLTLQKRNFSKTL